MDSPVPLCVGEFMRKKRTQGGSGLGTDIDRASVGRSVGGATNGDGGVHDPSVRPSSGQEEREREGGRALREKRQLRRDEGDELKYKGGT